MQNPKEVKTVTLVLGAGSSVPYGMPTGEQLKNVLASTVHKFARYWPDTAIWTAEEMPSRFRIALENSGELSVDAFLASEGGRYFVNYARFLIVRHLILKQIDLMMPGYRVDRDWYAWLFRCVHRMDNAAFPKLNIVTFNYELSLEARWMRMFRVKSPYQNEDRRFPEPIHVYGKLDDYPIMNLAKYGQNSPKELNRIVQNIRDQIDDTALSQLNRIKLMHEAREHDDREFSQARAAVAQADEIIFLGFGFDQTNMRRIGIDPTSEAWRERRPRVIGTCMGMSERRVQQLTQWFKGNDSGPEPVFVNADCLTLLEEHSSLADHVMLARG